MTATIDVGPRQSLARRIAAYCIAERGYGDVIVPEAAPLAYASDICLQFVSGTDISLLCLVDGEALPGRTFDLSAPQVRAIADVLLQPSTIFLRGCKSVDILVMETAMPEAFDARCAALDGLRRSSAFDRRIVSAAVMNTETRALWFSRWGASVRWGRFLKRVHGARDLSPEDIARQTSVAPLPVAGPPYATLILIAVLLILFAFEYAFSIGHSSLLNIDIPTLVAMGGVSKPLVLDHGGWYRMATAAFLHGGALHVALNCYALFIAGRILERMLGVRWFFATFAISAFAGSAMSMFINPPNLISVGASGAILGLFGTLLTLSFRFPSGAQRFQLRNTSINILVLTFLNGLGKGPGGMKIDFGAHLGGALAGLAIGALMIAIWPRAETAPRFPKLAAGICAVTLAVLLYAIVPLSHNYADIVADQALAPADAFPRLKKSALDGNDAYVTNYPGDPRGHLLTGIYKLRHNDYEGAEREARTALDKRAIVDQPANADLRTGILAILAMSLSAQGKTDEARSFSAKPCADARFRADLAARKLCD